MNKIESIKTKDELILFLLELYFDSEVSCIQQFSADTASEEIYQLKYFCDDVKSKLVLISE